MFGGEPLGDWVDCQRKWRDELHLKTPYERGI